MKILLAHSDAMIRNRFAQWLADGSHTVLEADNVAAACALLPHGADVVVTDWHLAGGGASFVKYLRTLGARHRCYLIVTVTKPVETEVTAIFNAGADDFAIVPTMTRPELLGRVDGLKRARAWAGLARGTAKPVELGPLFDLDKVRAWRELDAIVAHELSEQLGVEIHAVAQPARPVAHSGSISLSLAVERVELQLAIGVEREMVGAFADALLDGDRSDAAIEDALRELANVAGGALKRAAGDDAAAVTIGLPTNTALASVSSMRSWVATTAGGLRLRVAAVAWPCKERSVRRIDLREGMVLAADARNQAGTLLVAAGTFLTSTTVDGLGRTLDANALLEITEPMVVTPSRAA